MERRVGKKQDQILLQKVTSGILQEGLIVRTEEVSKRNLEGDIASLEKVSHYKNNIQNSQRRFGYGKEEVSKWNLGGHIDSQIFHWSIAPPSRRYFQGHSPREKNFTLI
jgi:hypothetical protein